MRFFWVMLLPLAMAQDHQDLRQRASEAVAEARNITKASLNNNSGAGFPAAIAELDTAAELYRQLNDSEASSSVFLFIGELRALLFDRRGAIEADDRAVTLAKEAGRPRLEMQAFLQAGVHRRDPGDHDTQIADLERALSLARQLGDRDAQAEILSSMARSFQTVGDFSREISLMKDRLKTVAGGNRAAEMRALGELGNALSNSGDYQGAISNLRRAKEIAIALDDPGSQEMFTNQMGRVNRDFAHYAEAVEDFKWSADRTTLQHMRTVELLAVGKTFVMWGKPQEAKEYVRKAMEAVPQLSETWATTAYQSAAPIYQALGQPQEALDCYRRASDRFRTGGWGQQEYWLAGVAEAELDLGLRADARQHLEAAIALTESARAKVASPELRATFLADYQHVRQLYIELLMNAGETTAAFQANERQRARSLLDALAEDRIAPRKDIDPVLVKKRRDLANDLAAMYYSGSQQEDRVQKLSAEYEEVEAKLRAQDSDYAALTAPVSLGVTDVQALLDDRTVLIEYSLGESGSYAWAIGKGLFVSVELPPKRAIDAAARETYNALTARNRHPAGEAESARKIRLDQAAVDLTTAARRLGGMILAPLAEQIRSRTRVLVVPDGALQYIPFAALPFESHAALVESHEVVELPSASVIPLLHVDRPRVSSFNLAIFADPVFDATDERVEPRGEQTSNESLPYELERSVSESGIADGSPIPRLPFSRREANRIAEIAGSSHVSERLDFAATKAALSGSDMARYQILHLATHSIFSSTQPARSGIVFSMVDHNGHSEDGFLRLQDIFNLRLNARIVVLSACETALGTDIRGEGLIGVTRGFFHAGASTVVSSLWRVDDAATADLMPAFYRGLLRGGLSTGAALRAAQLDLRKQDRFRDPYYWAAFVPQGDWR